MRRLSCVLLSRLMDQNTPIWTLPALWIRVRAPTILPTSPRAWRADLPALSQTFVPNSSQSYRLLSPILDISSVQFNDFSWFSKVRIRFTNFSPIQAHVILKPQFFRLIHKIQSNKILALKFSRQKFKLVEIIFIFIPWPIDEKSVSIVSSNWLVLARVGFLKKFGSRAMPSQKSNSANGYF